MASTDNIDIEVVDLDLDVEESNTESEISGDELIYPCVLLKGVSTEEEWRYIKECKCNLEISLPLFLDVDGFRKCVGNFELSLDNFLKLRYLSDKYKIQIHKDVNSIVDVDLNNADFLKNFIVI